MRSLDFYTDKNVAIIGGTAGLGLALSHYFIKNTTCTEVLVTGRQEPRIKVEDPRLQYKRIDLVVENDNWHFLNKYDIIIYCAGIGQLRRFNEDNHQDILSSVNINALAPISLINSYQNKLISKKDFRLVVITSIAGKLVSPLFSLYGATKSCISSYIQSVNVELNKMGALNKILEIAPGYIEGTSFYQKDTRLDQLETIIPEFIKNITDNISFNIPHNSELYINLIKECNTNPEQFGSKSYDYKYNKILDRKK